MILEMRYKNFRSMKGLTIFDMSAESICEFKDSIMKWNRNKTDEYRIVPFKILYGQNASGKTSIMMGIEVLKNLIIKGRVDADLGYAYDELVNNENPNQPITLGITFLYKEYVYSYDIEFTKNEVVYECLSVNRSWLFHRKNMNLSMAKTNKSIEFLDEQRVPSLDVIERQFPRTKKQDLYLSHAFKSCVAPTLGNTIQEYFENHLIVIMDPKEVLEQPIQMKNKDEIIAYLQEMGIVAEIEESKPLSNGIKRLINFADIMFEAIKQEQVVVLNEMDATIDPYRMIPLMAKLHDPSVTTFESQIVFDTYNPVYLDKYFVRRDEISFVSKDENGTSIKSLIKYANRENNYMRKYLNGEYDTVAMIDYEQLYQR